MNLQWLLCFTLSVAFSASSYAQCLEGTDLSVDPNLCETKEIRFLGEKFKYVAEKAEELGNIINIYEYLRNESHFKPYFGSKSNSLNSLEGLRGNDLDLATTLIAMLRSQGVKSRYSVGTIFLSHAEVTNWLNIQNEGLAVTLLANMGMKEVVETEDGVQFEHVWVEALVNYSYYRGTQDKLAPCNAETNSCRWTALDPSYKTYEYGGGHKSDLSSLNFDYPAFYSAEAPSLDSVNQDGVVCNSNDLKYEVTKYCCDVSHHVYWLEKCPFVENTDYVSGLKNLSPIEIFQEDAMAFLRDWKAGTTINDVIDKGNVIDDIAGLLPASLPYKLINPTFVRNYSSIAEHDAVADSSQNAEQEAGAIPLERIWARYVRASIRPVFDNVVCDTAYQLPEYSLSELSSSRFSLGWDSISGSLAVSFDGEISSINLGGEIDCGDVVGSIVGEFGYGSRFDLELEVDGSIDSVGGDPEEAKVKAVYPGLIAGGIYVIATGGEESNWSQVQHAYDAMLSAYNDYPLYTGAGGHVYVDYGEEETDTVFADDLRAQEALTGGLLYAAQRLFYAQLQDQHETYEGMKNITALQNARIGVVSGKPILEGTRRSAYDKEGSAFGFTPEGLLIDLKGNNFSGIWDNATGLFGKNEDIKFIGHMSSTLEHQTWQELTGLDAISTIRGLQLAKKDGTELGTIIVDDTTDTYEDFVKTAGYQESTATDYILGTEPLELFGRHYVYWDFVGELEDNENEPGMEGVLPSAEGVPKDNSYSQVLSYNTSVRDFILDFVADNQLELLISQVSENPDLEINRLPCDESVDNLNTVENHLAELEVCFFKQVDVMGWSDLFNLLDGFDNSQYLFRNMGEDIYSVNTLMNIQHSIYNDRSAGERWEYILPERPITGSETGHDYDVFYASKFGNIDAEDPVGLITAERYGIINYEGSAGGAYAYVTDPIIPSYEMAGIRNDNGIFDFTYADFFNPTFTDLNLIAVTNNHPYFAPSTIDPVSTVTGNMYHDETDINIRGLGLDYLITRTYNSLSSYKPSFSRFPDHWAISSDIYLRSNDYGEFPNFDRKAAPENYNINTSSITFVNERGGETNFLLDDSSKSSQPTSGYMNFDKLTIDTPVKGLNTLEFRNGVKYIFKIQKAYLRYVPGQLRPEYERNSLRKKDMYARISQIIHPNGLVLDYNYTEVDGGPWVNGYGTLLSITDNSGIEGRTGIQFSYHDRCSSPPCGSKPNDKLQYITDWTGRRVEYKYTDYKLSEVINLEGDSVKYTYDPDNSLLADVIKPEDRGGKKVTTTFSYYENERAYNYVDQLGGTESLHYDLYRKNTRVTHPDGGVTTHFYNNKGALDKMIEADGGILSFENNDDGFRYIKRDALGYETKYSYNSGRSLDGTVYETGDDYNAFGKVTREQDALGNHIDYTYGIYDQPTEIKDKRGVVTQFEYYLETNEAAGAVNGKLHKIIMPEITVNGVKFSNDEVYNVDPVGSPGPGDIKGYPPTDNPPSKQFIENATLKEFAYNSDGTIKRITTYIDLEDRSKKQTSDFTYVYNANGYTLTEVTSGATSGVSRTIVSTFDSLWRLEAKSITRRTSSTDSTPLTLTTRYEYDELDHVIATVLPNGDRQENIYDKNGLISQVIKHYALTGSNTDSPLHANCSAEQGYHRCVTQTMTYDEVDRLTSMTNIDRKTTTFVNDSMGRNTSITDANNHTVKFEYDAKGRRTAVTDPNGHRVETTYDLAGRVLQVRDPNGNVTKLEYDPLGRLTKTISPEGRENQFTQYDPNGNLIKVKDANNVVNSPDIYIEANNDTGTLGVNLESATIYNQYDELNRLIQTRNTAFEITEYQYDLLGNKTAIEDAKGLLTAFVYDDMGNLEYVKDTVVEKPIDKIESFTYDEVGNVISKTARDGKYTTYEYDVLNRVRKVSYWDNNSAVTLADSIEYDYDQYGDLIRIANNAVTYTYTYDNQHQLLSKTDSRNGKSLSWTYDDVGNLITKTDYQGEITNYRYDSSNRLVGMDNQAYLSANYQYDGNGALLSRTLSNDVVSQYEYDADGFLKRFYHAGADGKDVQYTNFTTDNVGNITYAVTRGDSINTNISYTYDETENYRLTGAYAGVPSTIYDLKFTYDDVGNRLTKFVGDTSLQFFDSDGVASVRNDILHQYVYPKGEGNRLTEVRLDSAYGPLVKRYEYDDNGNRVRTYDSSDTLIQSFTYDHRNLVTSTTTPAGTITFKYDPNGYRIEKKTADKTNRYLLEGEHLEAIYDENNQLQSSYLRGSVVDEIINGFELVDGKLVNRNFHSDQINSLIAMTDHNGNTVQTNAYGPFGESISSNGSSSNRFNYTGREQDDETGLYYYRARYYDPEIGRFISEDPIGFAGGDTNFYAYVGNNPLMANDPSGNYSTGAHNLLIERAFPDVSLNMLASIQAGSRMADSLTRGYQGADYAFMHAMTSSTVNREESRNSMVNYIDNEMLEYRTFLEIRDRFEVNTPEYISLEQQAGYALGMAMHPVMDSTSPAHKDYAEWHTSDFYKHGFLFTSLENESQLLGQPKLISDTVSLMNSVFLGTTSAEVFPSQSNFGLTQSVYSK